jgi:hypothetical protein
MGADYRGNQDRRIKREKTNIGYKIIFIADRKEVYQRALQLSEASRH